EPLDTRLPHQPRAVVGDGAVSVALEGLLARRRNPRLLGGELVTARQADARQREREKERRDSRAAILGVCAAVSSEMHGVLHQGETGRTRRTVRGFELADASAEPFMK